MGFEGDKIAYERIYWDQATLLIQRGLLDSSALLVSGPSRPSAWLSVLALNNIVLAIPVGALREPHARRAGARVGRARRARANHALTPALAWRSGRKARVTEHTWWSYTAGVSGSVTETRGNRAEAT
jgi:hypothetical protein